MTSNLCKDRGEKGFEILSLTFSKKVAGGGGMLVFLRILIADEKGGRDLFGSLSVSC